MFQLPTPIVWFWSWHGMAQTRTSGCCGNFNLLDSLLPSLDYFTASTIYFHHQEFSWKRTSINTWCPPSSLRASVIKLFAPEKKLVQTQQFFALVVPSSMDQACLKAFQHDIPSNILLVLNLLQKLVFIEIMRKSGNALDKLLLFVTIGTCTTRTVLRVHVVGSSFPWNFTVTAKSSSTNSALRHTSPRSLSPLLLLQSMDYGCAWFRCFISNFNQCTRTRSCSIVCWEGWWMNEERFVIDFKVKLEIQ